MSENSSISKALGTRHRAAIGISEVSDSVTIVVSEETGRVSVAYQGRIIKVSDSSELRNKLVNLVYTDDGVKTSGSRFGMWKMGNTNERKIKQ